MIRRPPRSTLDRSSAASDVYKRQITNLLFNPPKTKGYCDICRGELVQRSDDKDEVIVNRLRVYNEQTAPLLDYYTNKGLIKTIDGQGDVAIINNNILKVLP